jgi:cbb3-type cytochrome oxidase maturation protein
MKDYFYLIPIALGIGLTALAAFMWSLKNGQYDDLEGAAERILLQDDDAPTRRHATRNDGTNLADRSRHAQPAMAE